jgi:quercetin dioxygenase-like cupin family protein
VILLNKVTAMNLLLAAPLAACLSLLAPTTSVVHAESPVKVQPLLKSGKTVLGQPLGYREDGPLEVTSEIITVAPGGVIPDHVHLTPMYAYILEGAVTVHYPGGVTNTYRQGQAMLEAINTWHRGVNEGAVPVRILVVNIGVGGVPNTLARQ